MSFSTTINFQNNHSNSSNYGSDVELNNKKSKAVKDLKTEAFAAFHQYRFQSDQNDSPSMLEANKPSYSLKEKIIKKVIFTRPNLPQEVGLIEKAKTEVKIIGKSKGGVNKVESLVESYTLADEGVLLPSSIISGGMPFMPGIGAAVKSILSNIHLPKNEPELSNEFLNILNIKNDEQRDKEICNYFKSKNQLRVNLSKLFNVFTNNNNIKNVESKINNESISVEDYKSLVAIFYKLAKENAEIKRKSFSDPSYSKPSLNHSQKQNFLRSLNTFAHIYAVENRKNQKEVKQVNQTVKQTASILNSRAHQNQSEKTFYKMFD